MNAPERRSYVSAVLASYVALPETPARGRLLDRRLAEKWFNEGIDLETVEAALLLGQMRRLARPSDAPRLTPIRSLYYFVPIVEEILQSPLPQEYVGYLKSKLEAAQQRAGE